MQLILLCGVVCLLLLVIPVDLTGISCVARDAVVDTRTHFTCVFDRDINETKTGFLIWKYPLSSPQPNNSHREHVLSCNWKDSTPDCILESEKGYSFDYKITNTVFVDIASVNKAHEGTYLCQLVLDEGSVSNCSIRVTTTTTSTTAIAEDETASLKTAIIGHIIAISILAVAATLLLTSNIVTCCWARRKLQKKRRNQNYVYETEEVQGHTKKGYLCWTRGQKSKQKPRLQAEEKEELVMPARITVKYPANYVHKSTQHFVDVLDKNLQMGNPVLRTADVETQLGKKDEFPKWKTVPDIAPGVKIGSSERYNNPAITYLGKPAVIPLPIVPTAADLEEAYAKAKDADNELRKKAQRSISC